MPLGLFPTPKPPTVLTHTNSATGTNYASNLSAMMGLMNIYRTTGGPPVDMINVSGSGVITALIAMPVSTPGTQQIDIVIDGVTVFSHASAMAGNNITNIIGGFGYVSGEPTSVASHWHCPFNRNYKVTISSDVTMYLCERHWLT